MGNKISEKFVLTNEGSLNAEDFEAFEKVKKAGLLGKFAHFVLTDRRSSNNIFTLAEALEKKQIEDEKKGGNAE